MLSPLSLYAAEIERAERVRRAEAGWRLAELAASAMIGRRRAWLDAPGAWLRRLANLVERPEAAAARASGRIRSFDRGGLGTGAQVAQEETPAA